MDTTQICKMLDSLIESNKKAIIIDGAWGVGKTYQVKEFVKKNKNSKLWKIIYISLFGKKTIEEIHTQLYSQLHPTINLISKSITILSPATSLIPYAGKNVDKCLDFALQVLDEKTDERNRKKYAKTKKKHIMIIFDDLERSDDELKLRNFLGYINQLFLSQIKVAVICNSKEISNKEEFSDFKEKIFDRQYKIDKAQRDVIISYFREYELDNGVINNFEDNLRSALKTSLFFNDIKIFLEDNCSSDNYKHLSDKSLLWYCSLIVSKLNSKIDYSHYKERMKRVLNTVRENINRYFDDEEIASKLECIYYMDVDSNYEYSGKNDYVLEHNISDLICSFAYAYFYEDYSLLKNILTIRNIEKPNSIFDERDIFYFSKENKIEYIKKVLEEVTNAHTPFTDKEIRSIESIFNYRDLFPENFDEEDFAFVMASRLFNSNEEHLKSIQFVELLAPKFKDFFEKVNKRLCYLYINEIQSQLNNKECTKNTESFYEILQKLREKKVYHKNQNSKVSLLKEIEDTFYDNDLFLPDLKNDLLEDEWSRVHAVIDFMYDISCKDRLNEFLQTKYASSTNETEKERIQIFIKKYIG